MSATALPKLYVDRISQPSRSCILFCRVAGVPFEEVRVSIARQEQRAPEFLAVNPLGKVPVLRDGGLALPESAAIMQYLADTRAVPDHWYPKDPAARARVNAALAWHGSTLRVGSMVVGWNRAISLNLGFKGNEQLVQSYGLPTLKAALKTLDEVWLREGPYVAGRPQPSIADLLLACEVEQSCLLDGALLPPSMAELLEPHPRLGAWLERLRQACAPHYDDVHALLRKSRDRLVARTKGGASKL